MSNQNKRMGKRTGIRRPHRRTLVKRRQNLFSAWPLVGLHPSREACRGSGWVLRWGTSSLHVQIRPQCWAGHREYTQQHRWGWSCWRVGASSILGWAAFRRLLRSPFCVKEILERNSCPCAAYLCLEEKLRQTRGAVLFPNERAQKCGIHTC